jgi:AbrB family looped-hinge helix DNA binding protein
METKISSKGQVVVPASFRRKLNLRAGDALEARIDGTDIVLTPRRKSTGEPKIITDPLTGFPVLDVEGDLPLLTSEAVEEILADFP